jgi:hypothetical protein
MKTRYAKVIVTVSGTMKNTPKRLFPTAIFTASRRIRKMLFKITIWKKLFTTIERPVHNANPASKLWLTIVQMLRVNTEPSRRVTSTSINHVNEVLISLKRTIPTRKIAKMTSGILRK